MPLNRSSVQTILIVDDEPLVTDTVSATLQKHGYQTITTKSAEKAVAFAHQTPPPDLILMDIDLGAGMDGSSAAKLIISETDIPLLFLSGHTESEFTARTEKIPSYGFVAKDAGEAVLLASVRMAFRLFEAHKQAQERDQALRESEDHFRSTFQDSPDAININRLIDGVFVEINDGFTTLTGYTRADVIGKSSLEVNIWHNPADREELVRRLKEQGYCKNLEADFQRKDGSITRALMSASLSTVKGVAHIYSVTRDVSERKKAEDALRQSEERFRSLFDDAPVGYHVLDTEGRITNINRTELHMMGYERAEMIGQPIWQFVVEPESRAATLAKLSGKLLPGTTFERTFRRKDGSTFPVYVEDVLLKLPDGRIAGMRSTIQNIAKHKEAEVRLHESEERYRLLIENAAEVIAVIQDGAIKFTNFQAETLTGYSRRELLGKSILDLVMQEDRERAFTNHQLRSKSQPLPQDATMYRIQRKDGSIRWVEVRATVISWGGSPAALNFYTDISQRKKAEEALEGALQEKSALLNELQHRIKNSLTMITGLIGLESERTDVEAARTILHNLRDRVNSVTRLYALMHQTGEVQKIRLEDYFGHIVRSLSETYIRGKSDIQITERYEPVQIDAKSAAPCGLLLNELVTNALKYAFPGGRRGNVTIEVHQNGVDLIITVSDDGVGPPPDFSLQQPGGFGMRIIQLLAEQLDGHVTFTRTDRTTFSISIPLH